jgi:hypothetical protein
LAFRGGGRPHGRWSAGVPLQLAGLQPPPVGPWEGSGVQLKAGGVRREDWKGFGLEVLVRRSQPVASHSRPLDEELKTSHVRQDLQSAAA